MKPANSWRRSVLPSDQPTSKRPCSLDCLRKQNVCVCGVEGGRGLIFIFLKIRKEESGGLRAVGSENSEVARTREEKE